MEDTAAALFEFDSGTVGSVTVTHAALEPRDTLDIYGTSGSLHISNLNKGEINFRTPDWERTEIHPRSANAHQPLIEEFADAVISGRDPRVDGRTGRTVAELIDRIYGN